MILSEDLLVLLMDDVTGKPVVDGTRLDLALAGGVLLDLSAAGRVRITDKNEAVRAGRVVVADPTPTEDPILDEAMRRIAGSKPRKASDLVPKLVKGLRKELLARLVGRGVLRNQEGLILGIFPTTTWPAVDPRHEGRLREGLHAALVTGRQPSPREASVIALLLAIDQVPKVVGDVGIPKGELKRRAKEVAASGFADEAVRRAVEDIATATMVATLAGVTAATAGGG